MKRIVRKMFYDYEKEEKWLNIMSQKGYSLVKYTWCKYEFTTEDPETYIYRIELLDSLASTPASADYLSFLEDNGIQVIASYLRWVYLRKRASDGPFDLYTNNESKITYLKKIQLFWTLPAIAELLIGFANILIAFSLMVDDSGIGNIFNFNFYIGFFSILLGCLFLYQRHKISTHIERLKSDMIISD